MAEALVFIGLAANIAQFLELGFKGINSVRSSWESLQQWMPRLERIANEVRRECEMAEGILHTSSLSAEEGFIIDIAKECTVVAQALLSRLNKFRHDEVGHKSKAGFRRISRRPEIRKIEELESQMKDLYTSFKGSLVTVLQRKSYTKLSSLILALSRSHQSMRIEVPNRLIQLRSDILAALQKGTCDIASHLRTLHDELKRTESDQELLKSLEFPSIYHRFDSIEEAHKGTLRWIFDPGKTGFVDWLRKGYGTFWLSGLAGSGKSTVMKYISSCEETRKHLEEWAGGKKLHTGSFFFWASGNHLQNSQSGLLRSLLRQILQADAGLLRHLSETLPHQSSHAPWSEQSLLQIFLQVSKAHTTSKKFCFFVDGLDEFKGRPECVKPAENQMIELLRILSASENIKFCISSRPWPVFQKELGNERQHLVLQEFTKDDMAIFVHDMLDVNLPISPVSKEEWTLIEELRGTIVQMAEGMWLWAFLVIQDLLKDITNQETVGNLIHRIKSFPRTLNEYFHRMLDRLDQFHRKDTAYILLLLLEKSDSFPTIAFNFLEDSYGSDFPLKAEICPLSEDDCEAISDTWKRRLHGRCGDLIRFSEATDSSNRLDYIGRHRTQFLHRTVRDFVFDEQDYLKKYLPPGLSIQRVMAQLMLTLIKARPDECYDSREFDWSTDWSDMSLDTSISTTDNTNGPYLYTVSRPPDGTIVDEIDEEFLDTFFLSASRLESESNPLPAEFIDDLLRLNRRRSFQNPMPWGPWGVMSVYHKSFHTTFVVLKRESEDTTFLLPLVQWNLTSYLHRKLQIGTSIPQETKGQLLLFSLMLYVCQSQPSFFTDEMAKKDKSLATTLLLNGTSPNTMLELYVEDYLRVHQTIENMDNLLIRRHEGLSKLNSLVKGGRVIYASVWELVLYDYWSKRDEDWIEDGKQSVHDWMFEAIKLLIMNHADPNIRIRTSRHLPDDSGVLDEDEGLCVETVLHDILGPERTEDLMGIMADAQEERESFQEYLIPKSGPGCGSRRRKKAFPSRSV